MRSLNKPFLYVIGILFALGLIGEFRSNPIDLIIPLVIFGVVFYLYKFPPGRHTGRHPQQRRTARFEKSKRNSRKAVFRVIKGNKKDEENEPPRYH